MPDNVTTAQFVELFSQVSQSTKSIFDLTSRMDERVKIMVQKQQETENKIDKIMDAQSALVTRITQLETISKNTTIDAHLDNLETRVRSLETTINELKIYSDSNTARWKTISDIAIKIFIAVIGAWIVWKLGIQVQ